MRRVRRAHERERPAERVDDFLEVPMLLAHEVPVPHDQPGGSCQFCEMVRELERIVVRRGRIERAGGFAVGSVTSWTRRGSSRPRAANSGTRLTSGSTVTSTRLTGELAIARAGSSSGTGRGAVTETTRHIVLGRRFFAELVDGVELEHFTAGGNARAQALGEHLFVAIVTNDAEGDHGLAGGSGPDGRADRTNLLKSQRVDYPWRHRLGHLGETSTGGCVGNQAASEGQHAVHDWNDRHFLVTLAGFVISQRFVENRLRYVDAVQRPYAPLIAGAHRRGDRLPIVGRSPLVGYRNGAPSRCRECTRGRARRRGDPRGGPRRAVEGREGGAAAPRRRARGSDGRPCQQFTSHFRHADLRKSRRPLDWGSVRMPLALNGPWTSAVGRYDRMSLEWRKRESGDRMGRRGVGCP